MANRIMDEEGHEQQQPQNDNNCRNSSGRTKGRDNNATKTSCSSSSSRSSTPVGPIVSVSIEDDASNNSHSSRRGKGTRSCSSSRPTMILENQFEESIRHVDGATNNKEEEDDDVIIFSKTASQWSHRLQSHLRDKFLRGPTYMTKKNATTTTTTTTDDNTAKYDDGDASHPDLLLVHNSSSNDSNDPSGKGDGDGGSSSSSSRFESSTTAEITSGGWFSKSRNRRNSRTTTSRSNATGGDNNSSNINSKSLIFPFASALTKLGGTTGGGAGAGADGDTSSTTFNGGTEFSNVSSGPTMMPQETNDQIIEEFTVVKKASSNSPTTATTPATTRSSSIFGGRAFIRPVMAPKLAKQLIDFRRNKRPGKTTTSQEDNDDDDDDNETADFSVTTERISISSTSGHPQQDIAILDDHEEDDDEERESPAKHQPQPLTQQDRATIGAPPLVQSKQHQAVVVDNLQQLLPSHSSSSSISMNNQLFLHDGFNGAAGTCSGASSGEFKDQIEMQRGKVKDKLTSSSNNNESINHDNSNSEAGQRRAAAALEDDDDHHDSNTNSNNMMTQQQQQQSLALKIQNSNNTAKQRSTRRRRSTSEVVSTCNSGSSTKAMSIAASSNNSSSNNNNDDTTNNNDDDDGTILDDLFDNDDDAFFGNKIGGKKKKSNQNQPHQRRAAATEEQQQHTTTTTTTVPVLLLSPPPQQKPGLITRSRTASMIESKSMFVSTRTTKSDSKSHSRSTTLDQQNPAPLWSSGSGSGNRSLRSERTVSQRSERTASHRTDRTLTTASTSCRSQRSTGSSGDLENMIHNTGRKKQQQLPLQRRASFSSMDDFENSFQIQDDHGDFLYGDSNHSHNYEGDRHAATKNQFEESFLSRADQDLTKMFHQSFALDSLLSPYHNKTNGCSMPNLSNLDLKDLLELSNSLSYLSTVDEISRCSGDNDNNIPAPADNNNNIGKRDEKIPRPRRRNSLPTGSSHGGASSTAENLMFPGYTNTSTKLNAPPPRESENAKATTTPRGKRSRRRQTMADLQASVPTLRTDLDHHMIISDADDPPKNTDTSIIPGQRPAVGEEGGADSTEQIKKADEEERIMSTTKTMGLAPPKADTQYPTRRRASSVLQQSTPVAVQQKEHQHEFKVDKIRMRRHVSHRVMAATEKAPTISKRKSKKTSSRGRKSSVKALQVEEASIVWHRRPSLPKSEIQAQTQVPEASEGKQATNVENPLLSPKRAEKAKRLLSSQNISEVLATPRRKDRSVRRLTAAIIVDNAMSRPEQLTRTGTVDGVTSGAPDRSDSMKRSMAQAGTTATSSSKKSVATSGDTNRSSTPNSFRRMRRQTIQVETATPKTPSSRKERLRVKTSSERTITMTSDDFQQDPSVGDKGKKLSSPAGPGMRKQISNDENSGLHQIARPRCQQSMDDETATKSDDTGGQSVFSDDSSYVPTPKPVAPPSLPSLTLRKSTSDVFSDDDSYEPTPKPKAPPSLPALPVRKSLLKKSDGGVVVLSPRRSSNTRRPRRNKSGNKKATGKKDLCSDAMKHSMTYDGSLNTKQSEVTSGDTNRSSTPNSSRRMRRQTIQIETTTPKTPSSRKERLRVKTSSESIINTTNDTIQQDPSAGHTGKYPSSPAGPLMRKQISTDENSGRATPSGLRRMARPRRQQSMDDETATKSDDTGGKSVFSDDSSYVPTPKPPAPQSLPSLPLRKSTSAVFSDDDSYEPTPKPKAPPSLPALLVRKSLLKTSDGGVVEDIVLSPRRSSDTSRLRRKKSGGKKAADKADLSSSSKRRTCRNRRHTAHEALKKSGMSAILSPVHSEKPKCSALLGDGGGADVSMANLLLSPEKAEKAKHNKKLVAELSRSRSPSRSDRFRRRASTTPEDDLGVPFQDEEAESSKGAKPIRKSRRNKSNEGGVTANKEEDPKASGRTGGYGRRKTDGADGATPVRSRLRRTKTLGENATSKKACTDESKSGLTGEDLEKLDIHCANKPVDRNVDKAELTAISEGSMGKRDLPASPAEPKKTQREYSLRDTPENRMSTKALLSELSF